MLRNKGLALILALVFVLSISAVALAEEESSTSDDVTFTVLDAYTLTLSDLPGNQSIEATATQFDKIEWTLDVNRDTAIIEVYFTTAGGWSAVTGSAPGTDHIGFYWAYAETTDPTVDTSGDPNLPITDVNAVDITPTGGLDAANTGFFAVVGETGADTENTTGDITFHFTATEDTS